MAQLALTGPIVLPGTKGIVLPSAGVQTVGANLGISFVNNGLMYVALYIPSGYVGNFVQNFGRAVEGSLPAPVTVALAASTNYLFGPWNAVDFTAQDGTGLTNFGLSGTNTSVTVTLYELIPA
jgi:hypothetical protein